MSLTADQCVIGIDLGGTKLNVAAVDNKLNVLHEITKPAPKVRERIVADIAMAIKEVRAAVPVMTAAVGCGIPCLIDRATGKAVMAVNLPIEDLPFAKLLSEELQLPVYVDNDANVAVLAEHRFGAAQGAENVVMLTVGTGIGGGLILNGELYRGSQGAGAELGHMTVMLDGPKCQGNCPNYGCLEAVASGTALVRQAELAIQDHPESELARRAGIGEKVDGKLVNDCAHAGDPVAAKVIKQLGLCLGAGVVSYVNIFNPDFVVIGGGVSAAGELMLEQIRRVVAERALSPSREFVQIVKAQFGNEAGMIGAAALALTEIERRAEG